MTAVEEIHEFIGRVERENAALASHVFATKQLKERFDVTRQLTDHQVGRVNSAIRIEVQDEPGP